MTARVAVMAHYDPRGQLAPHVRRQVEALGAAADLVVVSTSPLTDAARVWLSARSRLVERANYGYDFYSYQVGLAAVDLDAYDEVTVCNDSYVGPLVPYRTVYDAMADRPVDFWGLTETDRVRHHVQSFFVTFRPWVVASAAFQRFWSEMVPLSDRRKVIRRYEVGLSERLYAAGFASAAYFTENEDDRTLGRRRVRWWAVQRAGLPSSRTEARRLRAWSRETWNPCSGLADRALGAARLPFVKVDTLRYDPYGLGAGRLLDLAEQDHQAAFEGVRGWLADSAPYYPPRPAEILRPVPAALRPLRPLVEYRRAG